ncbi:MAG: Tfp pilus assembly protein FimT/FimU [Mariprofundus sp.]
MRINPNTSGSTQNRQAGVSGAALLPASQRGFTLIELMIVIVIVAVLTTIGIPAFSDWREKQAVRSASQALMAHLKQARVLALSENRSVSITFTSTSYTYDADTSGNCGSCKKETFDLASFSSNLSVSPTTTRTFTSRGTVNSGNMTMTAAGNSKKTILNVIGRAYLQ